MRQLESATNTALLAFIWLLVVIFGNISRRFTALLLQGKRARHLQIEAASQVRLQYARLVGLIFLYVFYLELKTLWLHTMPRALPLLVAYAEGPFLRRRLFARATRKVVRMVYIV